MNSSQSLKVKNLTTDVVVIGGGGTVLAAALTASEKRARDAYESRILPRYQRRHEEVDDMVRNMFLAGVSTRRVGEILGCIGGEQISAQTVSRIAQSLDREVASYHRGALEDKYR